MKKIFFVIKALDNVGGTERVTIVLSNALVERGYEVHIVSLEGNNRPYTPVHEKIGLHYLVQGKDKLDFPFKDYRRHKRLKALFAKEQPDIIVLVDASRMMAKMPACKGFTTIAWEHFNTAVQATLVHTLSRQYMATHADAVVTLTQADAQVYQTRFHAVRALCIPNPITIPIKSPVAHPSHTILAVGRLAKQKGFDLLLKAWSLVKEKGDWKVQILGKGELETPLKQLSTRLKVADSVEFLPPSPAIVDYYCNSSIFALSSRYEGLPLVLIESGAVGLPAVSFDCKTGPSDIIVHQQTGLLIPSGQVAAFAEGLESLMHQPTLRKTYSENAQKYIAQKFSIDKIVEQWDELFHSLKEFHHA